VNRSSFIPRKEQIQHDLRRYLNIRAVSSPRFSTDGKSIALLSNITGLPQVWMVESLEENSPMQLLSVDSEERVGILEYSRSRDLIAYDTDRGGDERYQISVIENKGERSWKLADNPKVIHTFGGFSPDGGKIAFSSNLRNQTFFDVYVQDCESAPNSGELIYQSDETNVNIDWTPNGDKLLVKTIYAPFNHALFLIDLSVEKVEPVFEHKGDAVFDSATFGKDGRHIYCVSDYGREFGAIARIDLSESKLSYIHTESSSDVELMEQSPDGRILAFTVNRDGYSDLKLLSLEGMGARSIPLAGESPSNSLAIISDITWSNDSRYLAFTQSSSVSNTEIWIYDFAKSTMKRLTRVSMSGLTENAFSQERLVKYRSFDDLEIASYIYMPRETMSPAPLLVYLHGGPESQFRPAFSPLLQYFLHLGIAVGVPNFRGSTGYGRTFTHLDDVRKRMHTVRDVEGFLSHLKSDPDISKKIDFSKVAAWGGSYGGFMVLGCLYDIPDAWAAGVDIVGIANFVTFLKNTGPWRRKLRMAEYGNPEKDYDFLTSISPVTNAAKIKAPLFVIHGNNDPRVPLGEAEQIAETMQKLGREVHLLKFESEGHGLHKVKDRIEGYSQAIDFLLTHLGISGTI
jgi:dipeptidyl aminopeptidase/acylaminoacyl peptidase